MSKIIKMQQNTLKNLARMNTITIELCRKFKVNYEFLSKGNVEKEKSIDQ